MLDIVIRDRAYCNERAKLIALLDDRLTLPGHPCESSVAREIKRIQTAASARNRSMAKSDVAPNTLSAR